MKVLINQFIIPLASLLFNYVCNLHEMIWDSMWLDKAETSSSKKPIIFSKIFINSIPHLPT